MLDLPMNDCGYHLIKREKGQNIGVGPLCVDLQNIDRLEGAAKELFESDAIDSMSLIIACNPGMRSECLAMGSRWKDAIPPAQVGAVSRLHRKSVRFPARDLRRLAKRQCDRSV